MFFVVVFLHQANSATSLERPVICLLYITFPSITQSHLQDILHVWIPKDINEISLFLSKLPEVEIRKYYYLPLCIFNLKCYFLKKFTLFKDICAFSTF